MTKKINDIMKKYEDVASYDNVVKAIELIDDFMCEHKDKLDMLEYDSLMDKIEDTLYPFLTEEKAIHYVNKIVNSDGTKGPHFSMEQVSGSLMSKHIEKDTDVYSFYDLYTQINLVYSDLGPILNFDNDKIIAVALAYLKDHDFPGMGKISYTKWYCESMEKLEQESQHD